MKIQKTKIIKTKNIINKKGNIKKFLDKKSSYYKNFGEIYNTNIKYKKIKRWKYHKEMISNIFIISGKVKFVIAQKNKHKTIFLEFILILSINNIYIPNRVFFAFIGMSKKESILINFASIIHSDKESLNFDLDKFDYKWIKQNSISEAGNKGARITEYSQTIPKPMIRIFSNKL